MSQLKIFRGPKLISVKTLNIGVDRDRRDCVMVAFNGDVFLLSAVDAKKLFQDGLQLIETLCGAHADMKG